MDSDAGYLTVAEWPPGWGPVEKTLATVKASGLHPADAERRVQAEVPVVLARMPRVAAEAAADALRGLGVEALAIGQVYLAGVPPVLRAKRMTRAAPGRYTVELWRGRPIAIEMDQVWLVVRAKIRKITVGEIRAEATVVADEFGGYEIESGVTRERSIKVRELIELHLRDGTRVRVDGSKFNFDVLEGGKRFSDVTSADRLSLELATEAPGAVVDTGFAGMGGGSLVKPRDLPVPVLDRQRFPDDDPVFEFYSVWVSARYRLKLGLG